MKATEAIKQLQDIVTENGDLDLWVEDADTEWLLPINKFEFVSIDKHPYGDAFIYSPTSGYNFSDEVK